MSGTTVTVVNHGDRHKVPVNLDKPLNEVLFSFCASKGVADASSYTLQSQAHGPGKHLDLALTARQNNIVANAVLILVPRPGGSALGTEVRVAVQTSAGGRAQGTFTAGTYVADLLLSLANESGLGEDFSRLAESGFSGVSVVFMRSSVSGPDLASTTLAKLGASKGSVALRLNLPAPAAPAPSAVAPPPVQVAAIESAAPAPVAASAPCVAPVEVLAPVPAAPVPVHSPVDPHTQPRPSHAPPPVHTVAGAEALPALAPLPAAAAQMPLQPVQASLAPQADVEMEGTGGGGQAPVAGVRGAVGAARAGVAKLKSVAWDKEAGECLTTILKMLDNLLSRPGDAKVRSIRFGNAKFQASVGQYQGGLQVLQAVGFSLQGEGAEASYVLSEAAEEDEVTLAVRGLVASEAVGLGVTGIGPAPAVDLAARAAAKAAAEAEAARVVQVFDPFKPILMRVEADGQGVKPAVKVLDGSGAQGQGAAASAGAGGRPGTAAASSPGAAAPGSPMTAIERRVADMKARATAHQEAHKPASRATKLLLQGGAQAGRFSAEETAAAAAAASASDVDGGSAGGGGGGGAGGEEGAPPVPPVPMEVEVYAEVVDREASRLQMETMRKKLKQEKEEADKGFRTRAQREYDSMLTKGARVFTSTLIRVVLPPASTGAGAALPAGVRVVAQGTFSPVESVAAVHAWMAGEVMQAEVGAGVPFFLYTTPPPTLLDCSPVSKDGSPAPTLADLKLQPAAVLYLGWGASMAARLDPLTGQAPASPEQYVREDLLAAALQAAGSGAEEGTAFPTAAALAGVGSAGESAAVDAAAAALLGGAKPALGGAAAGAAGKPKGTAALPAWAQKLGLKRYTAEQSLPPLTDGTVDSVYSLTSALPFTAWGEVGHGQGVEDQPQEEGDGKAEDVRTFYPLPFPAFDEGKADVATGTVSIWSFRNGACSPQAEPYPGPQTLALGWWSGNPRHPERGTVIAMCDGDRGESLIGEGLPASGGGVIIHCPDRSIRGRTYDSTCELIRFRNNACIAAVSSRSGNVFSYQFRCRGTGN